MGTETKLILGAVVFIVIWFSGLEWIRHLARRRARHLGFAAGTEYLGFLQTLGVIAGMIAIAVLLSKK